MIESASLYKMDVPPIENQAFLEKVQYALRAVEWGTGMARAVYDPVVEKFAAFEPLAEGFVDGVEGRIDRAVRFRTVADRL